MKSNTEAHPQLNFRDTWNRISASVISQIFHLVHDLHAKRHSKTKGSRLSLLRFGDYFEHGRTLTAVVDLHFDCLSPRQHRLMALAGDVEVVALDFLGVVRREHERVRMRSGQNAGGLKTKYGK